MQTKYVVLALLLGLAVAMIVSNKNSLSLGQAFTRNANTYGSTASSGPLLVGPGSAAHPVVATRGNRTELDITNYGPTNVYLCKASSCANHTGILIVASSTYAFNSNDLYTGSVSLYTNATTTNKQV